MMWDRQPDISNHGGASSMGWAWPSDSSIILATASHQQQQQQQQQDLNYINHGLMVNPLANPATCPSLASPEDLVKSPLTHGSQYWPPAAQANNDSAAAALFNQSLVFHDNSTTVATAVAAQTGLIASEMSLYSGQMAMPVDAHRRSSLAMMNNLVKHEMNFANYDLSGALNLGGTGRINDYMLMPSNLLKFGRRPRPNSPAQLLAPHCQAEGCKANLSLAKHYHRRHKVCEIHSKSATVMLNGTTQRFCQQCSRFHALDEFDEGKRSCRKRLADHNKRRRKLQRNSNPSTSSTTVAASTDTASITVTTSQKVRDEDGTNLRNAANVNRKGDTTSEAPASTCADSANIKGDNITSEEPTSPSEDSSMQSPDEPSVKKDNKGPNLSLSMLSNSIPWQMLHRHQNHHQHGLLMQDQDIEVERQEEKEKSYAEYHHHYPFLANETNNSLHRSDPSKIAGLYSDWRSPFNKLIYNASDHCL